MMAYSPNSRKRRIRERGLKKQRELRQTFLKGHRLRLLEGKYFAREKEQEELGVGWLQKG